MQPRWLAWIAALALMTALAPASAAEDPAAPLLTEIQPDPQGQDRGTEWLEFANPTPVAISLQGFYVSDGETCFGEEHRYALEGTIPPMGRLVVTLPGSCLLLANTGDEIVLENEDGHAIQRVTYGPGGEVAAPSGGDSLTACQVGPLHLEWRTAPATPGTANPDCDPS